MKSYRFRVELEPEEDGWFVRCPTLERYGGAAWGGTEEEAHRRIREVLGLVVASMVELGMPVPEGDDGADPLADCRGYVSIRPELESIAKAGAATKTYQFRVVVDPDEDQWIAFCPALAGQGAATGGRTYEEAYINIHQVLRMTLASMISLGESIPVETLTTADKIIAVTL